MTEDEKPDPMVTLVEILQQMGVQNRDQMMEFAKELKKPTEREQRKIDEEDSRLARSQSERLALAQAEVDRIESNRKNCPHARVNAATGMSVHRWHAQVHSYPGRHAYFVPTCGMCQTQKHADGTYIKIRATNDMLTQGVELHRYAGITYESLLEWEKRCPVEDGANL